MATTTRTVLARFSANVSTRNKYTAEQAGREAAAMVAEEFPVGQVCATRLGGSDVFHVSFKFRAPEDIYAKADAGRFLRAHNAALHVAPTDAVQIAVGIPGLFEEVQH